MNDTVRSSDWRQVVSTIQRRGMESTDPLIKISAELTVKVLNQFYPWLVEQMAAANIDPTHRARIMQASCQTAASMIASAASSCMEQDVRSDNGFAFLMEQIAHEIGRAVGVHVVDERNPIILNS